ncbi:MAG: hypothetical protein IJW09_05765 [Clostridia bacterium]|nr:hypothetical protein [Clostridia bacterium]
MKKIFALLLALITVASLAIVGVSAEDAAVTEVTTEAVTEAVTEPAEAATEGGETTGEEVDTLPVEGVTEPSGGLVDAEWLYELLLQATPEQMAIIEDVVLGGMNTLDKLNIKGWDRVRVWIEHNKSLVLTVALIIALVVYAVISHLQKRGFAKSAKVLNKNAMEMEETTQKVCKTCADAAEESAQASREAVEEIKAEREEIRAEREQLGHAMEKYSKVQLAMVETVDFLLQASDLSQVKRDEAEAIFRRGLSAMEEDRHD